MPVSITCLICGKPLDLSAPDVATCTSCGQHYPITCGIPDLRGRDAANTPADAAIVERMLAAYQQSDFAGLVDIRMRNAPTYGDLRGHEMGYLLTLKERGRGMVEMFHSRAVEYFPSAGNEVALDLGCGSGTSMLALANLYADDSIGRYDDAIEWFNKELKLEPSNVDIRLRIASIYLNKTQNFEAAVKTLTEVTTMAPDNAMAFLLLGQAAKSAGQNQTAIMAWNRYLEMAPTSEYATMIKDEIAKLTALPAVTPKQSTTLPGSSGASIPVAPSP